MTNKKILITSALPYVNNVPHLGNIVGSVLSADVFARFNRSIGNETLFVCGTDEHGTATETKAMQEKLTPKEICDKYHKIHKDIYDWFNISFDIFGRTSDPKHVKITQDIFLKLHENGYITENEVEQLYCEKCDKFLADRFVEGTCPHCGYADARGDQCDNCGKLLDTKDLIGPKCKIHESRPIIKKTKHLYLDLKKIQPELENWVGDQSKAGSWSANAITTTNAWFREGLEPRAITRDLKWGVPVPLEGYTDKVFYVWFDAPLGYISITAELTDKWKDWWQNPDNVKLYQFMAKDNIPFHTIVFPAALIGTNETYTKLYHINSTEYLQYDGGKFSKSRHIGVFGDDAKLSGIPSDAYRYYLLINRPENADSTFTWTDFAEKINNELVANFGNLINRILSFILRYLDKKIVKCALNNDQTEFLDKIKILENEVTNNLENAELKSGLKTILKISQAGNQFFQDAAPWKTRTENIKKCESDIYVLANLVKDLAILIEPYLPAASKDIFRQLGIDKKFWDDLGKLSVGNHVMTDAKILFEKIDDKKLIELKERFNGAKKEETEPFSKLNLKVGKILEVTRHPDADKLYVEKIGLGSETRQIVSGLVEYYSSDELVGKNVVVVTNLKTAKLRGIESQGMILAVEDKKDVGVLVSDAKPGTQVTVEGIAPSDKEIEYADFAKVNMNVVDGVAAYNSKPFLADGKKVIADKLKQGKIC